MNTSKQASRSTTSLAIRNGSGGSTGSAAAAQTDCGSAGCAGTGSCASQLEANGIRGKAARLRQGGLLICLWVPGSDEKNEAAVENSAESTNGRCDGTQAPVPKWEVSAGSEAGCSFASNCG
jgi:hypothetical protein